MTVDRVQAWLMDRAFWLTLAGDGLQLVARDGKRYDYTMRANVRKQRA